MTREPIRVLHLGSPTGLYGAERWILALAKHLPPSRVESRVAVIKDSPILEAPLCEHAARLGLPTHVFESYGKLSLSAIGQLRRFILHYDIDVLHTHGYKTDIVGRLAVRGTNCKTIATPHGWSVNAGVKLQFYEALDRFMFRFMDAVVPLSGDLHAALKRRPSLRKRLHLIVNGVDLSDIDLAGDPPDELRAWRGEGAFIIGYVGQLISRKRIDTLIRAFHRLAIENKHLCLVGEGPQRAQLERIASELGEASRVTFFGYREDRIALLRGMDLFVLPSELEGIPRCLLEAMGAGIPVISSDIPGCRGLVETGVTGLLFPPGDDTGLARQIMTLINEPDLRAKLAGSGSRRVRATYSADAMARAYLALYERLVERRARDAPAKESA